MGLSKLTIRTFASELAAGNPTPGGGSVAALGGALGAALAVMVTQFTLGREKFRASWEGMRSVEKEGTALQDRLLELMQKDTDAYSKVMRAFKMPKHSDDEKQARSRAIQVALKEATIVPLDTLRAAVAVAGLCVEVLEKGNPTALTDGGVGLQMVRAAAYGAAYNVRTNLGSLKDAAFAESMRSEVNDLMETLERVFNQGISLVERRLR